MKPLFTHLTRIVVLIFTISFLQGCNSKESPLKVPLEKAPILLDKTPLQKEIKNLNDIYNTKIDYEWDRNVFAADVIADPADINDVLPYLEVLKTIYFEAMDKVSGNLNYSKNETPLTIYLMGSGINYGGTQSFGEGSAGQAGNIQPNRLSLGGLNEFGKLIRERGTDADAAFLDYILNDHISSFPSEGGEVSFVYHEYTHYIDSKRDIPKDFEKPAFENYLRGTNAYRRVHDDDARTEGFMLSYGMQNEHEDFATYVQVMVWKPRSEIESTMLLSAATKTKYEMVYNYYKNLGLDLFKLQKYLHSDEVKQKLLTIKHKYDGTM